MVRPVFSSYLGLAVVFFSNTLVLAQGLRPSEKAARLHVDLRTGISWTRVVDSETRTYLPGGPPPFTFTNISEKFGYHPPALRVMLDLGLIRAGMGLDHPFKYHGKVGQAWTVQADVPIFSDRRFCTGLNVHGGAMLYAAFDFEEPGKVVGGGAWASYSIGPLTQFTLTTSYDRAQQEPTFDKSEQVTFDAGMRFWFRTSAAREGIWEERADRSARHRERRQREDSTWRWVDHFGFGISFATYPRAVYFDMDRFEALSPYSRPQEQNYTRFGFSYAKVGRRADMHALQISFRPFKGYGAGRGEEGTSVEASEFGVRYQFAWNAFRTMPTKRALLVLCFGLRAAERELRTGQLWLAPVSSIDCGLRSRSATLQIGPKLLLGGRDVNFSVGFDLNILGYGTSDLHRVYDADYYHPNDDIDERLSRTDRLSFSDYAEHGLLLDNIEIGVSLPIRWKRVSED